MKSTLQGFACLLALASVLNQNAWSQASSASALSFNCDIGDPHQEARLLRATNGMAYRHSLHELKLTVAGKELLFKDAPPYDEPLDGVSYTYCGRKEGYSLVADRNGDLFTGKLIDERTGRVLPAGQEVLFSPDRRAYLASEQLDGMDGPMWTVYSIEGKVSWKGPSFVERAHSHENPVALDTPAWTATGELVAKAECGDTSQLAKLVKSGGKWIWRLPAACKENGQ
jgi:hypothetical protein